MKTRDEINAYQRAWRASHKEQSLESHRRWDKKRRLEERLVPSRIKTDRHIRPGALRLQELRQYKRLQVIKLLGNKCAKCGITDWRVLQINHINGGGTAEFRKRGNYYGLITGILNGNRATTDLELRCANCNILYEFERGTRYALIDEEKKNGF